MGRKHRGKRRHCSLRPISSFPTVVSKYLYFRHVKTRVCVGKGKDWSKLKAFADDKITVTQILKLVLRRVENIVGKGENAGY